MNHNFSQDLEGLVYNGQEIAAPQEDDEQVLVVAAENLVLASMGKSNRMLLSCLSHVEHLALYKGRLLYTTGVGLADVKTQREEPWAESKSIRDVASWENIAYYVDASGGLFSSVANVPISSDMVSSVCAYSEKDTGNQKVVYATEGNRIKDVFTGRTLVETGLDLSENITHLTSVNGFIHGLHMGKPYEFDRLVVLDKGDGKKSHTAVGSHLGELVTAYDNKDVASKTTKYLSSTGHVRDIISVPRKIVEDILAWRELAWRERK